MWYGEFIYLFSLSYIYYMSFLFYYLPLDVRARDNRWDTRALRQYVITRRRPPSPSLPLQSSWEEKKNFFFFFCIGGINSRHLDAARNRDFGGSINFKNRSEPLRRTRNGFFPCWEPTRWFCRRDLTQTCEDYSAFYRLHSPLYIWFPF